MQKRNTKQKKAIFEALKSRRDHPSASRLYEDLKSSMPELSKATVYRVLRTAADEGELICLHVGTEDRFDAREEGHCHIVCTACGDVFDAAFPHEAVSALEAQSDFVISERHVEFYGLCPACQAKARQH